MGTAVCGLRKGYRSGCSYLRSAMYIQKLKTRHRLACCIPGRCLPHDFSHLHTPGLMEKQHPSSAKFFDIVLLSRLR
jgi:hypothetical protein